MHFTIYAKCILHIGAPLQWRSDTSITHEPVQACALERLDLKSGMRRNGHITPFERTLHQALRDRLTKRVGRLHASISCAAAPAHGPAVVVRHMSTRGLGLQQMAVCVVNRVDEIPIAMVEAFIQKLITGIHSLPTILADPSHICWLVGLIVCIALPFAQRKAQTLAEHGTRHGPQNDRIAGKEVANVDGMDATREARRTAQLQPPILANALEKEPGQFRLDDAIQAPVNRHRAEGRDLNPGEEVQNQALRFDPADGEPMLVACLYSHWRAPGQPDLLSFAAITDVPPPEVAAAGHDR